MDRMQQIMKDVNELNDESKEKVLKFVIGYMQGSMDYQGQYGRTDGYVAFMEGIEYGISEYKNI